MCHVKWRRQNSQVAENYVALSTTTHRVTLLTKVVGREAADDDVQRLLMRNTKEKTNDEPVNHQWNLRN